MTLDVANFDLTLLALGHTVCDVRHIVLEHVQYRNLF